MEKSNINLNNDKMELFKTDFGGAIKALKEGKRVQREGWNGKGLYVFMQVPAVISVENTVPNMQSLPPLVKADLTNRHFKYVVETQVEKKFKTKHTITIAYTNQLALVNTNNNDITGWSPSTSDALAEDWVLLD